MTTIEADRLAQQLARYGRRIVFAESCTAGLVPALLAAVPGISNHLCGSWVTYRDECKQAWLGVPAALLAEHTAVSAEVTEWMAVEALRRSESAHLAAAITGHLGPDAPAELDGVCFLAVAERGAPAETRIVQRQRLELAPTGRVERQHAAARALLLLCAEVMEG